MKDIPIVSLAVIPIRHNRGKRLKTDAVFVVVVGGYRTSTLTPIKISRYGTVKLPQGRQLMYAIARPLLHKTSGDHGWPSRLHLRAVRLFTRAAAAVAHGRPSFYRTDMAMSYGNFLTGSYRRVIEACT